MPPPQSAYPAFVVGTLCIVGGITGFARTRSIPSIVAGVRSVTSTLGLFRILTPSEPVSVPCIFGVQIAFVKELVVVSKGHWVSLSLKFHHHTRTSHIQCHLYIAASAVLFLSSVPRAAKGPIPATLTVASAGAGAYYGNAWYGLRNN